MLERNKFSGKRTIIAGPCAAESEEQVLIGAQMALLRGVDAYRASISKPRTKHGWDGVGSIRGAKMMVEVAKAGIIPATEVLEVADAEAVINGVLGHTSSDIIIWIGSRNQNHKVQRDIGSLIKGEKRVRLGLKNQPWSDKAHFLGMASHVIEGGGASPEQVFYIHRGFSRPNRLGYRNPPDYSMALRVGAESGLPMLIDPSHIGGTVEKVKEVTRKALSMQQRGIVFDGIMVEVHPNPTQAITDAKQQLTWSEYDSDIAPYVDFNNAQKLARNATVFVR